MLLQVLYDSGSVALHCIEVFSRPIVDSIAVDFIRSNI